MSQRVINSFCLSMSYCSVSSSLFQITTPEGLAFRQVFGLLRFLFGGPYRPGHGQHSNIILRDTKLLWAPWALMGPYI
jgi:hypothetical protein